MAYLRSVACVALFVLAVAALGPASGLAGPVSDDYLHGYLTALLEHRFGLRAPSIRVESGRVTLGAPGLAGLDRGTVVAALAAVPGVQGVEVREQTPPPLPPAAPPPPKVLREYSTGALPGGQLFAPLVADPRWPHFAASWQHYRDGGDLRHVGAVSFGETFTLYRDRLGPAWWEVGIQAGVFALFDLEAASTDLVNADYFVAVPIVYRHGDVTVLGRIFHQSSHLGDEFVLDDRVRDRVNLSYEGLDLKVAYEFGELARVYAGGGYLFRREPTDLAPWSTQVGLELQSPWPPPTAGWRPIAAIDIKNHQEHGWATDVSARLGVQIDGALATRKLQLLLEFFSGHSPNGQFFRQKIEYFGLGAHLHF